MDKYIKYSLINGDLILYINVKEYNKMNGNIILQIIKKEPTNEQLIKQKILNEIDELKELIMNLNH